MDLVNQFVYSIVLYLFARKCTGVTAEIPPPSPTFSAQTTKSSLFIWGAYHPIYMASCHRRLLI